MVFVTPQLKKLKFQLACVSILNFFSELYTPLARVKSISLETSIKFFVPIQNTFDDYSF